MGDVKAAAKRLLIYEESFGGQGNPYAANGGVIQRMADIKSVADAYLASLAAPGDDVRSIVREALDKGRNIYCKYAAGPGFDADMDAAVADFTARLTPHLSRGAADDGVHAIVREFAAEGVTLIRQGTPERFGEIVDRYAALILERFGRGAADDGEALTEEFVRQIAEVSLPREPEDGAAVWHWLHRSRPGLNAVFLLFTARGQWAVCTYSHTYPDCTTWNEIAEVNTRGQLRALAAALGIPLSSPTPPPTTTV